MSQQDKTSAPPSYEGVDGARSDAPADPFAALEAVARMWPADAMEGMARAMAAFGASGGPDDKAGLTLDGDAGRAAMLMLKGYTLWTQQGIRYWSELAQLHGTHVQTLLERMQRVRENPETSDAERNALVDEAQRYLREVADVSMREGRVLCQELERLSAELRSEFGQTSDAAAPKRYVKAKS